MKESDLPLVRGGKLPKEALDWIRRVAKYFPGTEHDLILIRKPCSSSPRAGDDKGISTAREKV